MEPERLLAVVAAPPAPPLDLPRLVMRRAGGVVALGVLLLLLLGLDRMRDTVDDELAGAHALAILAERLSQLQALPDEAARQSLKAWQDGGTLRHLRVSVVDAQGQAVLDDLPAQTLSAPLRWLASAGTALFSPAPPFAVSWPLSRPQGRPWQVTWTPAPESERVEALTSLIEGVALLAGVGLLMLAVMARNTRQAFVPLSALLAAIARLEPGRAAPPGSARMDPLPVMPIAELETIASALRHLDAALETAEKQRRQLAAQVLSLQEDERQRLGRELHDEFGQRLTSLRVNATWLSRRLQHDAETLPVVQDMARQCEVLQQDLRSTLSRLRPMPPESDADAVGFTGWSELERLLVGLVADWQRGAGSPVRMDLQLIALDAQDRPTPWATMVSGLPPLSREWVLALYRVSQEALTNVARHAQAMRATLRLELRAAAPDGAPAQLLWSVTDDGCGLPDARSAYGRGNGLAGMKERLWALGSELEAGPATAHAGRSGCRLAARVSLPPMTEQVTAAQEGFYGRD